MNKMIWLLLGALFGLIFVSIAHRRARDERFLLAGGIVIGAWIYVPLAIAGNANTMWLIAEVLVAAFFTVIAWAGTRYSIWWLALGWGTHIIWDVGLHLMGEGGKFTGSWYPLLCAAFDLVAAVYISFFIIRVRRAGGTQIPQ